MTMQRLASPPVCCHLAEPATTTNFSFPCATSYMDLSCMPPWSGAETSVTGFHPFSLAIASSLVRSSELARHVVCTNAAALAASANAGVVPMKGSTMAAANAIERHGRDESLGIMASYCSWARADHRIGTHVLS